MLRGSTFRYTFEKGPRVARFSGTGRTENRSPVFLAGFRISGNLPDPKVGKDVMGKTGEILERGKQVLIGNYARQPVVMERGEGCFVFDTDGKRYLDLFAGFGGCVLGHCHPALVDAATTQAQKLWHVGNTFYTEPQIELAERLNKTAFRGQAFFCHSGLESNEA